jgi:hypothetical protein
MTDFERWFMISGMALLLGAVGFMVGRIGGG